MPTNPEASEAKPAPLRSFPSFHVADGLYFQRDHDGSVIIARNPVQGKSDMFIQKIPATVWASMVASVSKSGDNSETYQRALAFHEGGAIPA